jgi:ABC-type multidrug transport system permease subunit
VDGVPYVVYLVPGLIALNTMTQAYAISSEINIARFYHRIFEEFQAAPIGSAAIVAGEVAAGITRALLSAGVIVLVAALSGTGLAYGPPFLLAVVLNGLVFASLAVCVAMVVKAHSDQFLLTSFVITPMAFLGGTFFPVDRMPDGVRHLLHLLPITQASTALRAACLGRATDPVPYIALALTGAALFLLACRVVARAKD